jgi:hypothetical protein
MASTPRPNRLLRLSVVGAAVVTALTTATAAAAVSPVPAPARNQPTPPMGRTV